MVFVWKTVLVLGWITTWAYRLGQVTIWDSVTQVFWSVTLPLFLTTRWDICFTKYLINWKRMKKISLHNSIIKGEYKRAPIVQMFTVPWLAHALNISLTFGVYEIDIQVFWVLTPCQLIDNYRCFKGSLCIHRQSPEVQKECSVWHLSYMVLCFNWFMELLNDKI